MWKEDGWTDDGWELSKDMLNAWKKWCASTRISAPSEPNTFDELDIIEEAERLIA